MICYFLFWHLVSHNDVLRMSFGAFRRVGWAGGKG